MHVAASADLFFLICFRSQYVPWYGCTCICCIRDIPNFLQNVLWHRHARASSWLVHHACLSVFAVLETRSYKTSLSNGHK